MKQFDRVFRTCAIALVFLFIGGRSAFAGTPGVGEDSMSHHMNMLVLQLSMILVAAWFGGRLFKRMKFPSVLGELAAVCQRL